MCNGDTNTKNISPVVACFLRCTFIPSCVLWSVSVPRTLMHQSTRSKKKCTYTVDRPSPMTYLAQVMHLLCVELFMYHRYMNITFAITITFGDKVTSTLMHLLCFAQRTVRSTEDASKCWVNRFLNLKNVHCCRACFFNQASSTRSRAYLFCASALSLVQ